MQPAPGRVVAARSVILRGDKIVMMKRRRGDSDFYSFAGGHIEGSETPEAAVVREVKEELSLDVEADKLLYIYMSKKWGMQYFYLCSEVIGSQIIPEVSVGSEEYESNAQGDNIYEPIVIGIEELKNLNVLPAEVAKRLLEDLSINHFNDEPELILDKGDLNG